VTGARGRTDGHWRGPTSRLAAIAAAVVLVLVGCTAADPSPTAAVEVPDGDDVTVERVVDGDTLVVSGDRRVRLIGVDTPETEHPTVDVQCFGREASAFLDDLVPSGTAVRLVYDVERTDRYDRTLAYVYRRSDGAFVNGELVRRGFALVATVPPNVRHAERFVAWQREARELERGLWAACPAPEDERSAPGATTTCEPSYPTRCLPPPPPDLDCGDLDGGDLVVRPPDPHRLDGDGDGIACAR
jgi:micrococcal nuclease